MPLELAPLRPALGKFLREFPRDEQVRVRLRHALPFDPWFAHEFTFPGVIGRRSQCPHGSVVTEFHDQFFEHKGFTFEHVDFLP